ncbi:13449_t:CDS:2 [Rhizophagus irregularis]|nr:13449_t:CDS:2 [Rhizophagus irregularis]
MLIYIVNTLKVLANIFLYLVIVVALIALAWIILWKLILNQVSFIREIAGLPKLSNNKLPQQQTLHSPKKRRQSSVSLSTTHSRQQSITSTHSKQQSISSTTYGGGSVSMSRRISSSTNKTYQSQDDIAHKNYHHTKSDSRTSIKSSSNKILPIENDENLNFEEGYIS